MPNRNAGRSRRCVIVSWRDLERRRKAGLLRHILRVHVLDSSDRRRRSAWPPPLRRARRAGHGAVPAQRNHEGRHDDGRDVVPGSGELGRARAARPDTARLLQRPASRPRRFTINGERYSVPGDWATVDADGAVQLLGRGSQCINTGGEKVYPRRSRRRSSSTRAWPTQRWSACPMTASARRSPQSSSLLRGHDRRRVGCAARAFSPGSRRPST